MWLLTSSFPKVYNRFKRVELILSPKSLVLSDHEVISSPKSIETAYAFLSYRLEQLLRFDSLARALQTSCVRPFNRQTPAR